MSVEISTKLADSEKRRAASRRRYFHDLAKMAENSGSASKPASAHGPLQPLPSRQSFLDAMRVPKDCPVGVFGRWSIGRVENNEAVAYAEWVGPWKSLTILRDVKYRGAEGQVVMEDSQREMSRHLPVVMGAWGAVLVTGFGLGCVVRGLIHNPRVTSITVVEKDRSIRHLALGYLLPAQSMVSVDLILADALDVEAVTRRAWDMAKFGSGRGFGWDFAWHDIHNPSDVVLQHMHARLIAGYAPYVRVNQGAWAFPRVVQKALARKSGLRLLGGPRP